MNGFVYSSVVCVCMSFGNLSKSMSANVENFSSLGMQFMAVTAHFLVVCVNVSVFCVLCVRVRVYVFSPAQIMELKRYCNQMLSESVQKIGIRCSSARMRINARIFVILKVLSAGFTFCSFFSLNLLFKH